MGHPEALNRGDVDEISPHNLYLVTNLWSAKIVVEFDSRAI